MKNRPILNSMLSVVAAVAVSVPVTAWAVTENKAFGYNDVPADNVHGENIQRLSQPGPNGGPVSVGCTSKPNPPNFCPEDFVKRDQMMSFMNNLAESGYVDAGTLDGMDASDFLGADYAQSQRWTDAYLLGADSIAPHAAISPDSVLGVISTLPPDYVDGTPLNLTALFVADASCTQVFDPDEAAGTTGVVVTEGMTLDLSGAGMFGGTLTFPDNQIVFEEGVVQRVDFTLTPQPGITPSAGDVALGNAAPDLDATDCDEAGAFINVLGASLNYATG